MVRKGEMKAAFRFALAAIYKNSPDITSGLFLFCGENPKTYLARFVASAPNL